MLLAVVQAATKVFALIPGSSHVGEKKVRIWYTIDINFFSNHIH